jgi:hypothetical protein
MSLTSNESAGTRRVAGIGCLGVLLLAALAAYLTLTNWNKVIVAGFAATLDRLQLPAEEKAAALAPIREMADKVRTGELSAARADAVTRSIERGPVPSLCVLRVTELTLLPNAGLPADEVEPGRRTVTRFAQGTLEGRIEASKVAEVVRILTVPPGRRESATPRRPKPALSAVEMRQSLKIMKAAADYAGIEDRVFAIDLAAEIRRVVSAGLEASAPQTGR